MKIECVKDDLVKAVSLTEKLTGKKLPLPILGKILLHTKDKGIYLRATNLDMGVEIMVPGKVLKAGSIVIPGGLIEGHLNNLPSHIPVTLESSEGNLLISTNNSLAKVGCESVDEFPILPNVDKAKGEKISNLKIKGSVLAGAIRSVAYSASLSDIKPELASVYMYKENGELILVATDSFRLAEKRLDVSGAKGEMEPVMIPIKNALEISKLLNDVMGDVVIEYNSNLISIKSEDLYCTSRLIEGNFPNYAHIIPKTFKTKITTKKNDLQGVIRLVSVFADKFSQINLKVLPEDSVFELEAKNQERGESAARVESTTDGERVDISINSRYLSDCFQSLTNESLTIGLNDNTKPLVIQSVGDRSFTYLIMPLHK